MLLNIYFYSHNANSFNNSFIVAINDLSFNNRLRLKIFTRRFPKKNRKTKFTVLKSPNANKIAQEQLKDEINFKQISISTFQIMKLLTVVKKIYFKTFTGGRIKIKVFFYNTKRKEKNLTPNKYLLQSQGEKRVNKTVLLYLKLFDSYGETSFFCLDSSVGRAKD